MQTKSSSIIGILPFLFWGLYPFYFKMMADFSPLEITAHRITWTVLIMVPFFLFFKKDKEGLKKIFSEWRYWVTGAFLICSNWSIYSYAVLTDQVQQASLAYFVTPLFNLAIAAALFGERLHKGQKFALVFLFLALFNEAATLNEFPWIAAMMAVSFTGFSYAHKKITLSSTTTLTMETVSLLPIGLSILGYQYFTQASPLINGNSSNWLVAMGTGIVTILPLIFFNKAAQTIPLSKIAVFQYLSPTLMFLQAKFIYMENISETRIISFVTVWLGIFALSIYNLYMKVNFFEIKAVKQYILKRRFHF